jgi:hypothetical protein
MTGSSDGKWSAALNYRYLHRLLRGEAHTFADWPNPGISTNEAAVFTVWRERTLLLAEAARVADGGLMAVIGKVAHGGCAQLWHTVIRPSLPEDQSRSADEDSSTRESLSERFCRDQCSYRFVPVESDAEADELVAQIHAGALSMDQPLIRNG